MRINTNVSAIIANHHLNKTDNALTKSMQRLSSGLKINRAEDDSAGIAIASKMHTQIDCIGQTGRNGNDGVSVVQTAEGALSEIEAMLQRMRELAVQGANGTNSDDDRKAIQQEITALQDEIVRVTQQTKFTSITLLDGSLDRRSYCTVTGAGNVPATKNTSELGAVISLSDYVSADIYGIEVTEKSKPAAVQISANRIIGSVSKTQEGIVRINNDYSIQIEEGDTQETIESKLEKVAIRIGATYEDGKITTDRYGSKQSIELNFSNEEVMNLFTITGNQPQKDVSGYIIEKEATGQAEVDMAINLTGQVTAAEEGTIEINGLIVNIEAGDTAANIQTKLNDVVSKIDGATYTNGKVQINQPGTTVNIDIKFSSEAVKNLFTFSGDQPQEVINGYVLKENGKDVTAEFANLPQRKGFSQSAKMAADGNYITVTDSSGFNMVMRVSETGTYTFDVTDMGTMPIQIGIAEGQIMDIRIPTVNMETLGLTDTQLNTQENCRLALNDFDKAISYISSVRGSLGAYQNRLESAVRSIDVSEESMTAAVSRIEDTDMAEEMTTYTQMNVLAQAGVSVLAQANERPQLVLQLLQ